MIEDIEPLPPELWFERIAMISRGELGPTENALRHAFHLLQLTPREFRPREYGTIDEADYETLLGSGDLEAAARRLVAAPTLTVSTMSDAEGVEAAIKCTKLRRTVLGKGETPAAAILRAWANCLFELKAELGPDRFSEAMRG